VIDPEDIQRRARKRLRVIERMRRDPRYRRVLGRFVAEGVLTTNERVSLHQEALEVADVLWAGRIEPRFLELLPALLVRRPSMFADAQALPPDLAQAVRKLRRNLEPDAFRGIPGDRLRRWLSETGRKRGPLARLKSFRLKEDDLRLLKALSEELGISETEVVRRGLRALL